MAFYSASDFSFMFDPTLGVGTATTYYLTDTTVNLIFRTSEYAADGISPTVQGYTTSAKVQASDVPDIAQGQAFFDGTTVFVVIGIGPNEEGLIELDLRASGGVLTDDAGRIRQDDAGNEHTVAV